MPRHVGSPLQRDAVTGAAGKGADVRHAVEHQQRVGRPVDGARGAGVVTAAPAGPPRFDVVVLGTGAAGLVAALAAAEQGASVGLFEKTVESTLLDPTFVYAYPVEVSPLSRPNDADEFVADRFEFFLGGREIANGFSELNDPEEQAARFRAQAVRKDKGDEEAMFYDADYVRALEYGLPPTAGLGVGIDRLVMFFTDSASIRDVILFPHMRPEAD